MNRVLTELVNEMRELWRRVAPLLNREYIAAVSNVIWTGQHTYRAPAQASDAVLTIQAAGVAAGTGGAAVLLLVDGTATAGRIHATLSAATGSRSIGIQAGKDRDNTTLPIRLVVLNGSGALIDALSCAAGTSAGRVGINGVTSPSYPLDVAGDVNLTGVLRVNGTQVQGARQAAIANATTTNADLQRAVNAILAALRTKGEIAP